MAQGIKLISFAALLLNIAIANEIPSNIKVIGHAAAVQLHSTMTAKVKKQKKVTKDKIKLITFCKEKAKDITKGVNEILPDGVTVKRTTKKYRDSENKPNNIDLQAINYFENIKKNGKLTKKSYKIIATKNGYNYYKPMIVKKACLTCHGDMKKMEPNIKRTILKYFPDDKAHGYKEGDLRGVITVEISEEAYEH